MCFNKIAPILAHINDESLLKGAFPDGIKIAKVVPIFENGEPKFVSNYRLRYRYYQHSQNFPFTMYSLVKIPH